MKPARRLLPLLCSCPSLCLQTGSQMQRHFSSLLLLVLGNQNQSSETLPVSPSMHVLVQLLRASLKPWCRAVRNHVGVSEPPRSLSTAETQSFPGSVPLVAAGGGGGRG